MLMGLIYRKKSKAIIVNHNNDFLIAQYKSPWEDGVAKRWIPWWGIDNNETYLHWARREVYEEVGIDYHDLSLLYTYPGYFIYEYSDLWKKRLQREKNRYEDWEKVKFFIFKYIGDKRLNLIESEEFCAYKWVDLDTLLSVHKSIVQEYILSVDIENVIAKS